LLALLGAYPVLHISRIRVKDQELHTQWHSITTQTAGISNSTAVRATDYGKRGFYYLIIIVFMGKVA